MHTKVKNRSFKAASICINITDIYFVLLQSIYNTYKGNTTLQLKIYVHTRTCAIVMQEARMINLYKHFMIVWKTNVSSNRILVSINSQLAENNTLHSYSKQQTVISLKCLH